VIGTKVGRNQRLDRPADQLVMVVAEHVLHALVGQRDHAVIVGQHHPVTERVQEVQQDGRGDGVTGRPSGLAMAGGARLSGSSRST